MNIDLKFQLLPLSYITSKTFLMNGDGYAHIKDIRHLTKLLRKAFKKNGQDLFLYDEFIKAQGLFLPLIPEKDPPQNSMRAVSSVHGKLNKLLIALPADAYGDYNYKQFVRSILEQMQTLETLFIIAEDHFHGKLRTWLDSIPTTIQIELIKSQNTRGKYELWARDPFWLLQDAEGTEYIVEQNANMHANREFPSWINLHMGTATTSCDFKFEGGNILVGDTFVLMGSSDAEYIEDVSELEKRVYKWFGKKLLIVGLEAPSEMEFELTDHEKVNGKKVIQYQYEKVNSNVYHQQVFFHIDLFLTLAGQNEAGEYLIVVGVPVLGFELPNDFSNEIKKTLKGIIDKTKVDIGSVRAKLCSDLDTIGVNVRFIEIPLPLIYHDTLDTKEDDSKPIINRSFSWASYNNCLAEFYQDPNSKELIRQVWLPSYGTYRNCQSFPSSNREATLIEAFETRFGLKITQYADWSVLEKFDRICKEKWKQEAKFNPIVLNTDFNPYINKYGSLNCMTNCMGRLYETTNAAVTEKPRIE